MVAICLDKENIYILIPHWFNLFSWTVYSFFMLLLIILWSRIDNIPRSTLYYDTFTLTRGQRRDDREEDASTENTLQDKKANPTIFYVCTESRWENERKIILDRLTTLFDSISRRLYKSSWDKRISGWCGANNRSWISEPSVSFGFVSF